MPSKTEPFRCWCGKVRKPWMNGCRKHRTWTRREIRNGKRWAAKMREGLGWT